MELCRLVRIGRAALLEGLRRDPDLALEMIRLTVARLRWVSARLKTHAFQPLSVRLARRLLYLLATLGAGDVVPMSQGELAEHVGATREAVSKILAEWRQEGTVALGGGRITVLDRDVLGKIAAAGLL